MPAHTPIHRRRVMLDDINARLADAQKHVEAKAQLTAALPQTRENLGQERYQLEQLEGALERAQAEIEALECLTLQSLWDSILGRKQRKLDRLSDECASLADKCEECRQNLEGVAQDLVSLEEQLAAIGDPETELETLVQQKVQMILERNDANADALRAATQELETAKWVRQILNRAEKSGKLAVERLHSMTKAVGRAQSKSVGSRPAGVVGAALVNTVLSTSAEPIIRRARSGLAEFRGDLAKIHLDDQSEFDAEIARLIGMLDATEGELAGALPSSIVKDMGRTLPMLELVQTLIGHLGAKREQADQLVRRLEESRRSLVESA